MGLASQIAALARHSAIYGLGGLVSRVLAVLLLPLYTRYLTPADYGAVETLVALSAVLVTVLRMGISSAFFRFYFDSREAAHRLLVVRTSFWFTMVMATAGLVAGLALAQPLSRALFATGEREWLVRAAFLAVWAQMNYEQLTALFRVEQRSLQFVSASLANVLITVGATVGFVVGLRWGATGVVVGNVTGTLCVYAALLSYRREQLGLQLDRALLGAMNRFGLPLVPSALALWALNLSDRFFLVKLSGQAEVGLYSLGARISSAMLLLLTAFRTAWPAFAYSIEDDREARRTYSFVLTYLLLLATWAALALGLLSPWIVRVLATPDFYGASRVVALLAFAAVASAGYTVIAIGVGRARRTQFNWVVTGSAAAVNVGLNLVLIPSYGMMGAAVSTVAAYSLMFLVMAWWAQRVYPVPYQWRRVATLVAAGVGLCALGKGFDVGLGPAIALSAAYPLVLLPLRFYLPAELRRMRRLVLLPRA